MAIKSRGWAEGDSIDYTPAAAGTAGDIVFNGSRAGQVVTQLAAGEKGALRVRGVIVVNKDSGTFTAGQNIGWNSTGTDVGGATGGAATSTVASMDFMLGRTIESATGGATTTKVALNEYSKQLLTNSTAGTAATALATMTGTNLVAGERATIDNNFATIWTILHKAGIA